MSSTSPDPSASPATWRGPGMFCRTYHLPTDVVAELDRAVVNVQANAYVDRAPDKAVVIAAVIRAGLSALPEVVDVLRTRAAAGRAGWQRPVALPDSMNELKGPLSGLIRLPLSVHASGVGHDEEFDFSRPEMRAAAYQILLREASAADLRAYVNGPELKRLWPRLWLPRHVRDDWARKFSDWAV